MLCSVVLLGFMLVSFTSDVESAKTKDPPVYKLPPYISRACSRNDPNVEKCVIEVGGSAIKSVVKGDPKYKIPQLDPLVIEELRIKQGTKQVGLELVCINCRLWGLHNTKFVDAKNSWEKRECRWDFTLDKLQVKGKYNVSGQVLLLPIVGHGDAEINLEDLKFSYMYDWTYEKKSNGFTYVVLGNSTFPLEVGHMTIKLDNLFNGDPLLGSNMNRFLNEHWKEIMQDLTSPLSTSLAQLTSTILGNMAKVVPFDYMFPDT